MRPVSHDDCRRSTAGNKNCHKNQSAYQKKELFHGIFFFKIEIQKQSLINFENFTTELQERFSLTWRGIYCSKTGNINDSYFIKSIHPKNE